MEQLSKQRLQRSSLMSRSFTPENVLQSKLKYETNKNVLEKILKLIILMLVAILVLIIFIFPFLTYLLNSIQLLVLNSLSESLQFSFCQKLGTCKQEQTISKDYSSFGSRQKDLQFLNDRQIIEGTYQPKEFSIKSNKLEFPIFEQMYQNRNHSLEELKKLRNQNLLPDQKQVDEILKSFYEILPMNNDQKSEQDMNFLNNQLLEQNEAIQKAIDMKSKTQLEILQQNAYDLEQSYNNYIDKKKQVILFRQKFTEKMKILMQCDKVLYENKTKINSQEEELIQKKNLLSQENEIQDQIIEEINLEQQNLQNLQTEFDNQRQNDLTSLKEWKYYINNSNQVLEKIENLELEQKNLKSKLGIKQEEMKKQQEFKNLTTQELIELKKEQTKLISQKTYFNQGIKIFQHSLSMLINDHDVKEYMRSAMNPSVNVQKLAELFGSKIEDEKEMLKEITNFKESNQLFNNYIVENPEFLNQYNVSQEIQQDLFQLEKQIQEDKEEYKNISTKYLSFMKQIANQEDYQLKIEQFQITIQNMQNNLNSIEPKLKDIDKKIFQLEQSQQHIEFSQYEKQIQDFKEQIKNNLQLSQEMKYNLEKADDLKNQIHNKINQLDKEFIENKIQLEQKIQKLELTRLNQEEKIRELTNNINSQVVEFDRVNQSKKIQSYECYSLYIFYQKTVEAIPKIKEIFQNDQKQLENIKRKFVKQLDFIKEF